MIEYSDNGDFYRLYEDPTTPERATHDYSILVPMVRVIMGFLRTGK
ncbi:hypothetical protein SFC43_23855 [Bacteroides sp. CR5/BHMF/2]|nr:hypothetical protein [Bacteroides sp. CR5/BHMF/2]